MSRFDKAAFVAVFALALAAAATLRSELTPFTASPNLSAPAWSADGQPLAFGYSTYSRDLALDRCRMALTNPVSRLLDTGQKTRLLDTCESTAMAIVRSSPANAYAWAIAGYTRALRGDDGEAVARMERSQRLSPRVAWLAQLRLRPFHENLSPLPADAASVGQDVRLLGGFAVGRRWLAGWYGARAQMRDFILNEIETLPPNDQRAFIEAVRLNAGAAAAPQARS